MRIGIVGAGPAGLTLAHALLYLHGKASIDEVRVYDRCDVLKPAVGGGLQLSCGAATLARLGIDVTKSAAPLRSVLSRNVDGTELLSLNVQESLQRAKAPLMDGDGAFGIMRETLMALLAEQIPDDGTLQLDKRVVSVRHAPGSGSATLCFEDGTEDTPDLVVGCDGISSVVKSGCFPNEAAPEYSGVKMLLAVAPAGTRPAGSEGAFHQWLGDGAYCLSASYGGAGAGGPAIMNDMLALCYADAVSSTENPGWLDDTSAARAIMQDKLKGADFPAEVNRVAEAATRFYETSVYFRTPSLKWSTGDGAAVLCGDAAHAMPPFLGQGANQAILDAYRLASEIKQVGNEHPDIQAALKAYQSKRFLPTTKLLLNSRILGFLETQAEGGIPGAAFRDKFFYVTGKLGVAEFIFRDAATLVA